MIVHTEIVRPSEQARRIQEEKRKYCDILLTVLCQDDIISTVYWALANNGFNDKNIKELKELITDALEEQILY